MNPKNLFLAGMLLFPFFIHAQSTPPIAATIKSVNANSFDVTIKPNQHFNNLLLLEASFAIVASSGLDDLQVLPNRINNLAGARSTSISIDPGTSAVFRKVYIVHIVWANSTPVNLLSGTEYKLLSLQLHVSSAAHVYISTEDPNPAAPATPSSGFSFIFNTDQFNMSYSGNQGPFYGNVASGGSANVFNTISGGLAFLPATTLPVVLRNMAVTSSGCRNTLQWTVSSELNFDRYDVETSNTGIEYERVLTVQGNHRRETDTTYTASFDGSNQKQYVRLRMTDLDGFYTYSKVLVTRNACNGSVQAALKTYPNPATDQATIYYHANGAGNVLRMQVFNTTGQILQEHQFVSRLGNSQLQIPVDKLQNGLYYVRVTEAGSPSVSSAKLIVQH